jgi:hypothetical protein
MTRSSSITHSGSLGPSDSVSQVSGKPPLPEVRPTERPDDLTPEVLWHIKDCQHDSQVSPMLANGNTSRPNMKVALRQRDGTLIDDTKYRRIQEDVRALYNAHLYPLSANTKAPPTNSRKKTTMHCMTWFRSHHRAAWDKVVHQLESIHPILQLCAGNWKAEHMIQAHLQSLAAVDRSRINAARSTGSKSRSGGSSGQVGGCTKAKDGEGAESGADSSSQGGNNTGLDDTDDKTGLEAGNSEQEDLGFADNVQGTQQENLQRLPSPPPTSLFDQTDQTRTPSKRPRPPSPTGIPNATSSKKARSDAASQSVEEAFGALQRQTQALGSTTAMIDISSISVLPSCECLIFFILQRGL